MSDPQQKTRIRFQLCGTVRSPSLLFRGLGIKRHTESMCARVVRVMEGRSIVGGVGDGVLFLFCFLSVLHFPTELLKNTYFKFT